MMQEGAVYWIANCILNVFVFVSTDLVCERRFRWPLQLPLEVLSSVVWCLLIPLLPLYSSLRFVVGAPALLILDVLLHKGSLRYRALTSILAFLCMIFSEVLFMGVMPREAAVSGELYQMDPVALYAVYLFLNAVVMSIMVVAVRYFHKKYRESEYARQWLLFPIFPISQLASLLNYASIYIQREFQLWGLLATIAVYVLADVALIVFIRMTAKNMKLQARTELLEEQIEFQKDYYKQLSDSYEKVRKMRHDIDNHLYTIKALLASGETEEAARYEALLTEQADLSEEFEQCRNKVVASYLQKKKEDLKAEGITFETRIVMPEDCGIGNPDLICVLGNLLGNAEEAAMGLENGFISLEISHRSPYLSICVKNRARTETDKKKSKRIAELERGIGMSILKEMAQRYDGDLKTSQENDIFQTDLVLKGESTC